MSHEELKIAFPHCKIDIFSERPKILINVKKLINIHVLDEPSRIDGYARIKLIINSDSAEAKRQNQSHSLYDIDKTNSAKEIASLIRVCIQNYCYICSVDYEVSNDSIEALASDAASYIKKTSPNS